jgi:hypothetical protein
VQLEHQRKAMMNESFHTEDCALSLICRCCRDPVCKRTLTKADRLRTRRELWAQDVRLHHHGSSTNRGKMSMRTFLRGFLSGFVNRVTRVF